MFAAIAAELRARRPGGDAMSVSVVIAAFDVEAVIERAIASVLAQTRPVLEILVVDDASRDRTRRVVAELARRHAEIRLIPLDRNVGPARARNKAVAAARGDWIAVLDADDAWRPERIAHLLAVAAETGADFVADNQILFDAVAGREVRPGFVVDWRLKTIDAEDLFRNDIIGVAPFNYGGLKPLIRRGFLTEKALAYDERLRYGEDFKLYAELIFKGGKAVLSAQPLYVFSTRQGELSGRRSPHSRTRPRFDVLIATSDELARDYRPLVTAGLAEAMALRRAQLLLIHKSNVARELRVWRTLPRYVGYVIANPDLLVFLARRLGRRARNAAAVNRLAAAGAGMSRWRGGG
jgi:succinoglycan biosynthesis protein ExoO